MKQAVLLILILSLGVMAATVEIKNGTDLELYFIWITEAGREKWVDMLSMSVLLPDSSLIFQVTRGWYDLRIQDSEWQSYTLERIPLSDCNHFIWVVEPIHRDNP